MKSLVRVSFLMCLLVTSASAQVPQTVDELTKQTDLLKAQQTYYDQLLATSKSQQAASSTGVAAQTAAVSAANDLKKVQVATDFVLSDAIKGSGLSAAVGKDGTITLAAADKTLLMLQRGSLGALSSATQKVCDELTAKSVVQAFIAPANFEMMVQKSIPDVVQLYVYHETATTGIADFGNVKMEVAGAALAGAMVSAEYLAGGVQSLTKLFRTDYNVTFTPSNRQGLFEQMLASKCPSAVVVNAEARLRLNAAAILIDWIPTIARFVQMNDMWTEIVANRKAANAAEKTTVIADQTIDAKEKGKRLKTLNDASTDLQSQDEKLAKYKAVAMAMKTYLSTLSAATIMDSMVWGQDYLTQLGGLPTAGVTKFLLLARPRLTYTLNIQDAAVKASYTFRSDKLRSFSTVELYFNVIESNGDPKASGVYSITTPPLDMDIKELTAANYPSEPISVPPAK